jgi:serine/threonine-protein kinase
MGSRRRTAHIVPRARRGRALAERLERGAARPANEALRIVRQMAEARGQRTEEIVHRDIKPANVKITGGRVKVWISPGEIRRAQPGEWRVALSIHAPRDRAGRSSGHPPTEPGTGRGGPWTVARTSGPWVACCELLSGRRPFGGATLPDTLAAVLEHEPGWQALPSSVTRSLEDALRRCLQKEASRRFQDCAELVAALEDAGAGSAARGRESPGAAERVAIVVMPLTTCRATPRRNTSPTG